MTRFSLPITQAANKAAFFDADSATRWLAGQPQANASAMSAELVKQIGAFNGFVTAPRSRFKTLEVLRKTLFVVSGENQKRFENKPLPLSPTEQTALDSARRLWRTYAQGYLNCLSACLDRDATIVRDSARVAHRVLACLRMEQMVCYLAGSELAGEFWRSLHAVWASVEELGVEREPVADRLLGETSESTLRGQYCMILLLHLARPFSLSRGQYAATTRWFARWREQAAVLDTPDENPKSCCIALDLSQDRPIHDNLQVAKLGRWLSINDILRKMRKRIELLTAGETPESLKLGSGLSSEASVALLNALSSNLKHAEQPALNRLDDASSIIVASGLENMFYLLGGKGLKELSISSSLSREQIAVFGHVVRESEGSKDGKSETWIIAGQEQGEIHLIRPAGSGEARLLLRGLLAIKIPQQENFSLALISRLNSNNDGSLSVSASVFSGEPAPLLVEMCEKPSGKISRHPAFLLPSGEGGSPPSVILSTGLPARALSIRFYEPLEQTPFRFRLVEVLERGGDNERWLLANEQ